ncbi:MAG: zinc ABC transporter substrate-binding protein, partial [Paenibacillaceae bacterium]|nr:zinc ABC transporter substrate-binding protein [Paenibacillaceae bacterium]
SAIDNPNVLMIEASKGLATLNATDDPTHDHGHDHAHEKKQADKQTPDPHVWLSLPKAIAQVRAITNALAAEFPDLAQTMQANAAQYTQELAALYETYRKQLAPYAKRAFVTQHAAFAYLAESFDLVQYPISGISPQQEPSPARMAQLIKVMNKERVRTVYFETLASSKTAEAIAKETGALTAVLHPLEALTEEEQQANDTYIAIMERNINALLKGFVP